MPPQAQTTTELKSAEPITLEEFGRKVKEKYPDYRTRSDKEVAEAMLQKYPEFRSVIKTVPAGRFDAFLTRALGALERGTTLGPTIGGGAGAILGGVVGGPGGALVGASLGAAGGKAIERRFQTAGQPPPRTRREGLVEAGKDLGSSALISPAFEAAGQGMTKVIGEAGRGTARWLMNRATRGPEQAKWLKAYPGVTDFMIDKAITMAKGGMHRAEALLSEWSGTVKTMLAAADQTGKTVPVRFNWDMANLLEDALLEDVARLPSTGGVVHPLTATDLPLADQQLLRNIRNAVQHRRPVNLPPSVADRVKRQVQAFVRPQLEREAGQTLASGRTLTKGAITVGRKFQKDLNYAIDGVVSGYKDANKVVQLSKGAGAAAERRSMPKDIVWPLTGIGATGLAELAGTSMGAPKRTSGAVGATIGFGTGLLNSPRLASWLSIAAGNPEVRAMILSQLARMGVSGAVQTGTQ